MREATPTTRLGFLAAAVVAALALVAGACSDDDVAATTTTAVPTTTTTVQGASTTQAGTTDTTQPAQDPRQGGELRIVWGVDADSFDPAAQAQGTARELSRIVLQGLTQQTADGDVLPLLAESWDISEDGLTWTFNLRDDIVFQDGTPFNSSTVVANMDRWLDPDFGHTTRSRIEDVSSTVAIDDSTVEFRLSQPIPLLAHTMAEGFHLMLSQKDIEDHYLDLGRNLPTGTGPFKLVEFEPLVRMVLERWDDYKGPGEVFLDRILFETVSDTSTRTARLLAGEADLNIYQSLLDVGRIEGDSNVELVGAPALRGWQFYINSANNPHLDDVKIRQAMNHAVDQQAIIDVVFQGNAELNRGMISLGHAGWMEVETFYEFDPDRAIALMAEAGWTPGDDGKLSDADGNVFKVRMDMSTGGVYVADDGIGEAVAGYFEAIGIEVERVQGDRGAFFGTILAEDASGVLQVTGIPLFISFQDGATWLALTYGESSRPPDCCNLSFYDNPAAFSLIDRAVAESDLDERVRLAQEAQRLIWQDVPSVLGPQLQWVVGKSTKVKGVELMGNEGHNIAFVWLEE